MALHVRDLGEGPPVVFLHPGPGLDGSVFLPGVDALVDAGFRALLVDLPGQGRSPGDDFTLRAQAAAVEELMRELDQPTLLGHSFGGYVAMQYLVDFPGNAARLVASSTDSEEEEPEDAPEDRFEGLSEEVAAGVRGAFERESSVTTPEECLQSWRDQMPFFAVDVERTLPMLDDVVFQVAPHTGHDLGELHALDALAATDIPVLAMVGSEDRPTPPACARRIADTAPRAELVVFEGVGHFPFAEAPERYWPALISWLERTGSGG
jgi:pimeloyl-ACP methyl ester carboxylesterase